MSTSSDSAGSSCKEAQTRACSTSSHAQVYQLRQWEPSRPKRRFRRCHTDFKQGSSLLHRLPPRTVRSAAACQTSLLHPRYSLPSGFNK
eukprot:2212820-Pleurochrysis_carterae.AAC.1